MTVQEILTLAQAGFNAQQIAALNGTSNVQQTVPVNPVPGNNVQQNMYGTSMGMPDNPLMALSNQIQQLNTNFQMAQIQQSSLPAAQSTEDILAEIINPPNVVQQMNGQQYMQMPQGAPMAVPNTGGNKK